MRNGHAEIAVGSTELQAGRPGAGDPPARQGGRVAEGAAQELMRSASGSSAWRSLAAVALRRRVAGGGRARARRRSACAPFASGLRLAGLRDGAPRSEPGKLYVVEQPGVIRVLVNGQAARAAVPRHPQPRPERRRAGPALGRVPPELREEPPLLRLLQRHERRHARRRVPLQRDGGAAEPRPSRCCASGTASTRTTTAASSQFGPDGLLYAGTGDGGSGGDPNNHAQNLGSRLGKLLRLNVNKRGSALADRRLRAAQPVALLLGPRDAATSTSATSARARGRRSTCARPAAAAWLEQLRLARLRGPRALPGRPAAEPARDARLPDRASTATAQGCSITGGYVYRGKAVPVGPRALLLRRLLQRHDLEPARRERARLRGVRREPFKVPSLSSFGEDARGELYAVSLERHDLQAQPLG